MLADSAARPSFSFSAARCFFSFFTDDEEIIRLLEGCAPSVLMRPSVSCALSVATDRLMIDVPETDKSPRSGENEML